MTVIVVSLDTTRPDHLTPYGYEKPTSGALGRLAREGVLFTNARTTTSWTLPSHMSLFTGLPPGVHDVIIDFQTLDRSRKTMGEVFRDADFRTMGLFSGPYVHGHFGFRRGFDFYESMAIEPTLFDLSPAKANAELGRLEMLSHREVTSKRMIERAQLLLKSSNRPRNLLFLHMFDPHYDYLAPKQYTRAFTDPRYRGPVTGENPTAFPDIVHADMPDADRAHLEALYDAEIAWVDANLASLLIALERQDRIGSTVVVVTADHGEAFFEHGRFGHRGDLYDEVLRIPLIVWGPGIIPEGKVLDADVSLYDILPTLMDYADIQRPDLTLYGRSLRPMIEGEPWEERPVVSALSEFPADPQGYYVLHEAMVFRGYKVVSRVHVTWDTEDERDISGDTIAGSETIEIYDLEQDPTETTNLYGTGLAQEEPLLAAFVAERERQRDLYAAYRLEGSDSAAPADLSVTDMMKAMGYLGGSR